MVMTHITNMGTWNERQGRRTHFLKAVWYSSTVYKANEKILSIKYSPNSVGYNQTQKEPLPKDYIINMVEGVDPETGLQTVKDQVIKITYVKENPNDKNYIIKQEYLYKTSRLTGKKTPKLISDFYNDEELVNPENKYKFPNPQGIFMCKTLNAFNSDTKDFSNMVHYNENSVQIETKDFVKGIKKDDYVYFKNNWWRVNGVQTREIIRSQEFLNSNPDTSTIISLIR